MKTKCFYVQFIIVIFAAVSAPVRGQNWLSWQQWSSCAAGCAGQQVRIRQCRQTFIGATFFQCRGEFQETRLCEASAECSTKLILKDEWGAWGPCSKTCDIGTRIRYRRCSDLSGLKCQDKQGELCTNPYVCSPSDKDGEAYLEPAWMPWANWSPCSSSCGGGTRKRFRKCSSQAEDPVCRKTATQVCNVQSCPRTSIGIPTATDDALYLLPWESWSRCSLTCGGGIRERIRRCAHTTCIRSEREACNRWMCVEPTEEFRPTPSLSSWSIWGPWSACLVTCGFGVKSRNRRCQYGDCIGLRYEIRECNFAECPKDEWSDWSNWSACSVKCGKGYRRRSRSCKSRDNRCSGLASDEEGCEGTACVEVSTWENWSGWSSCSATCGYGNKIRARKCSNRNGKCNGRSVDVTRCQIKTCISEWSKWSNWSRCSATCGSGFRNRSRTCEDDTCLGDTKASQKCNEQDCPVQWSRWSNWSKCSVTCGAGVKNRSRTCRDDTCLGNNTDARTCSEKECSGWSYWSQWSGCIGQCDQQGWRLRTRICKDGKTCKGSPIENEKCQRNCLSEPEWMGWDSWSPCTTSCGEGSRKRTRKCLDERNKCKGRNTDSEKCNSQECIKVDKPEKISVRPVGRRTMLSGCGNITVPLKMKTAGSTGPYKIGDIVWFECQIGYKLSGPDHIMCEPNGNWSEELPACVGEWSEWGSWDKCSVSCGTGIQKRNRKCTDKCEGNETESRECSEQDCPSKWSQWQEWGVCSKTCGFGIWERKRTCDGNSCRGSSTESGKCFLKKCPVVKWSDWTEWGKCNVTCGSGFQERERQCLNDPCVGETTETRKCTKPNCLPGKWSNWGTWSKCSASCGQGTRIRKRQCGDKTCLGQSTSTSKCSSARCQPKWSNWKSWSKCSSSCGSGIQRRKRVCNAETSCKGFDNQTRKCSEKPCVEAKWSQWTSWTKCSATCGSGNRQRTRKCGDGAKKCKGPDTDSNKCNTQECIAVTTVATKIKCAEVKSPFNGRIIGTIKSNIGAVIRFVCLPGFTIKGSRRMACRKNGKWSAQAPSCVASSCPKQADQVEPGRNCSKPCSQHEQCNGISKHCVCDDACGKSCFDPESVTCDQPIKPENGFVFFQNRSYGQTVRYSCKSGYTLFGTEKRVCRSDSKWSGKTPSCIEEEMCGIAGDVGDIFKETTTGRVIAGDDARRKAWPWQAMIAENIKNEVKRSFDLLKGGGSVVNEKWILSAAHVFGENRNAQSDDWKESYFIILGITTVPKDTQVPNHVQIFAPESVLLHTKYNLKNGFYDYDVAMIKVGTPFKTVNGKFVLDGSRSGGRISFSDYVRPVCLPCFTEQVKTTGSAVDELKLFEDNRCSKTELKTVQPFSGSKEVVVTGYGKTRRKDFFGREIAGVLQQGLLKLADTKSCESRAALITSIIPHAKFTKRMICTLSGRTQVQVDACKGDSGGPLVRRMVNKDGSYYWLQLGIVSWGLGCAYTDANGFEYPGFYTNLASVMPFVVECMINH